MKKKQRKPVNWGKVLKKAVVDEENKDFMRVVEIIRELHYIVIQKYGQNLKNK